MIALERNGPKRPSTALAVSGVILACHLRNSRVSCRQHRALPLKFVLHHHAKINIIFFSVPAVPAVPAMPVVREYPRTNHQVY